MGNSFASFIESVLEGMIMKFVSFLEVSVFLAIWILLARFFLCIEDEMV